MASENGKKSKDEGFTRLPHEIIREYLPLMKEGELKITLVVVDETYGWGRPFTILDLADFETRTDLSKPTIRRGIDEGLKRGTIQRSSHPDGWAYRINPQLVSCPVNTEARKVEARKNCSRSNQAKIVPTLAPTENNFSQESEKIVPPYNEKESKEKESDKDLQLCAEPEDSFALSEEKKEKDGLPVIRTKPEVLNTPRDPLYIALDEHCEGRGTGGPSFIDTLKALNEAALFACDLDDMAERIRKQYNFERLSPGNFKGYLTFYLSQREKEEETRQKEAADRAYTEQYYREQAIRDAERDRKAAIDTEKRKQARLAAEKIAWEEECASRRDRLERMAVPKSHSLWRDYRTVDDPAFNKAIAPFVLIFLERTEETYAHSAGAN